MKQIVTVLIFLNALNISLAQKSDSFMKHEKEIYSPYQIKEIEVWEEFLAANTDLLKSKFTKIIERYSFDNLKNLLEEEQKVVALEFWQEAHELTMRFSAIDEDESPYNNAISDEALIPNIPTWMSSITTNSFIYPSDLDVYYEEYRDDQASYEKYNLFFEWIANCWIACGGLDIGICSSIIENSVTNIFNLNDISWKSGDWLVGEKLPSKYNRKLTKFEVRVKVRGVEPDELNTSWRYFESETEFFELGTNGNLKGERRGLKTEFDTKEFILEERLTSYFSENAALKRLQNLVNQGFEEKARPSILPKLDKTQINWRSYIYGRTAKPLDKDILLAFQKETGNIIGPSYLHFLEGLNGRGHSKSRFRLRHEVWRMFEEFYKIEDLAKVYVDFHKEYDVDKKLIPFAKDKEGGFVLLNSETDYVFLFDENLIQINTSFADFQKGWISTSGYSNPKSYHIERGNVAMVKKWIEEGWDMKDIQSKRGVLAGTRNYEITELLLKNGADPNKVYIYGDNVDYDYLKLLIQYGFDFKAALEKNKWLERNLRRRDGLFDDLLKEYVD